MGDGGDGGILSGGDGGIYSMSPVAGAELGPFLWDCM